MFALLLLAAAAATEPIPAAAQPAPGVVGRVLGRASTCGSGTGPDIEICARRGDQYRIDPSTLAAIRAREALPAAPEPKADVADSAAKACVGPQSCQGDFVPLVGAALTVLKAAELAARGEDWREALRNHVDDYRLYQQAEQRRADARKPKIGLSARN